MFVITDHVTRWCLGYRNVGLLSQYLLSDHDSLGQNHLFPYRRNWCNAKTTQGYSPPSCKSRFTGVGFYFVSTWLKLRRGIVELGHPDRDYERSCTKVHASMLLKSISISASAPTHTFVQGYDAKMSLPIKRLFPFAKRTNCYSGNLSSNDHALQH